MRFITNLLPDFFYKFLKSIHLKYRIKKNRNSGLKLVLGSGGIFEKGWIPTNIKTIDIPNEKDWKRFFKENSISMILAEHVWEHLTFDNGRASAKIIFKYLEKNGHFRIAVPDGYHPDPNYIVSVDVTKDPLELIIPDSHKFLYNYNSLKAVFEEIGFKVDLLEYYDEFGKFHFNSWDVEKGLVYRSERFKFNRPEMSILNMPNYSSLIIDATKP